MTLGTDFKGGYDLDPNLAESSGTTALAECIIRRLTTERGTLEDYPNYGEDLTQYIGRLGVSPSAVESAVTSQCYQEEEVDGASVVVEFIGSTMVVKISIVAGEEPFELTLNVDELQVTAIIPE